MSWISKLVKKYEEHRFKNPKRDMEFKTEREREKHFCNTKEESEYFLSRLITMANQAKAEGRKFFIQDAKMSSDPKFDWTEEEMKAKGASKRDIGERKEFDQMTQGSRAKRPYMKVARYWENRKEDWASGLCGGKVAVISIAALDDKKEDYVCCLHCGNLTKENKGIPNLSPLFWELAENEAKCFFNVLMYEDLDAVIRSFLRQRTDKIKFVEADPFFQAAWGPNWNGFDENGNPRPTNGLLPILEHAFPGWTQDKHPRITNSDWMKMRLSHRQK